MSGALPKITFLPRVSAEDPVANYWLAQVTTRLRREVCWLWHERGATPPADPDGVLPPYTDRLLSVLNISRYAEQKLEFFEQDTTAAYLTERIQQSPPDRRHDVLRGSMAWVVSELAFTPVDCFVLALALAPAVDSAAGSVMAACLNDPNRTHPTLGLAQRLWDRPRDLLGLADPSHPLYRYGLLATEGMAGAGPWDVPLVCPPPVVARLLYPGGHRSHSLRALSADPGCELPPKADFLAARLAASAPAAMRVVPIVGAPGAPFASAGAALGAAIGATVVELVAPALGADAYERSLDRWLTTAWLGGEVLLLPPAVAGAAGEQAQNVTLPCPDLPVTVFAACTDRASAYRFSAPEVFPPLELQSPTFGERLEYWREGLALGDDQEKLAEAAANVARRFRFERQTILRLAGQLRNLGRPVQGEELTAACAHDLNLGELAQLVRPRFELDELVLPPAQSTQIDEIIRAMRTLTRVHYEWGTARAWNESGLTALFAGPPGTGKTMAAEVIAAELHLELYRIDLSQVVNKYIGETEKNLRRLFDAADSSDVILFFDEADSLFGKRTQVKDAHDRYANLEVSYLLERMERFKGLAILATNRKKDLDEAFLRRLRFVIDFPMPGQAERYLIWEKAVPDEVDASALDLRFLARQFPLAGGHIRGIVFNACLQAAEGPGRPALTMAQVVRSVRREYDKLERVTSLDQFGPYATFVSDEGSSR